MVVGIPSIWQVSVTSLQRSESESPVSPCRWVVGGWPAVEAAGRLFNTVAVKDYYGRPVLLFKNEFSLQQVMEWIDWESWGEDVYYLLTCDYLY